MKQVMQPLAGLWIDHREAVIVILSDKGQETKQVKSHVEKQLRRSGRSPSPASFEAQMMPADDSREREYSGHLASYYDEVISCLRPAKAILLFGPGEAKGELRKRLERNKLDVRIARCKGECKGMTCPNCDTVPERVVHYSATGPLLNSA